MKKILVFFLILPSLLWAKDVEFNCDLQVKSLNSIALPDIYNFNIVNLRFIENNNIWELFDLNLDKSLKINAKKAFEYEIKALKNIIRNGRVNYNEKYLIKLMQEMDYGFTFNQFMNEIKNANQSEKNYLIKVIDEATIEGRKYINELDFSDFQEIKDQILSEFENYIDISSKRNDVIMSGFDGENSLKISIKNLNKNTNLKPIDISFDIDGYNLSLSGSCNKIINSLNIKKTYEEIDCFKDTNLNLFPEYCASKILDLYQINESENGSKYISNDKKNDNFIEFCNNATLDSLDRDVVMLCLEKME